MFIQEFKDVESIISQYEAPKDALDGAKIYLAWYGYGDYCGSSLVIFKQKGNLYEVNGSHCSCSGLEGQWTPEETSWKALSMRAFGSEYKGSSVAQAELEKLIARYSK
jgi:hypothetical protein